MRRRVVIGGLALGWTVPAQAQRAPRLIGMLLSAAPSAYAVGLPLFRQALGEAGYIDGREVRFEQLSADGRYERLPAMAAELIAQDAALIAAFSVPAALAAKAATTTIPIVMMIGADPVELGLVTSLREPGGNVTGVTQFFGELGGKRLDLLLELVPAAMLIAVLVNRNNQNAASHLRNLETAARSSGRQLHIVNAANEAEIDTAFAAFSDRGAQGLVIADDPIFLSNRHRLIALAARHRLPTIYYQRQDVHAGGLISYAPSSTFTYRQGGLYAARVLSGIAPASLPIVQPTNFELVINLQTARTLGLAVPPTLLARADEVIE